MKKKYKLFFGSMAISLSVTAAVGALLFWQLYASSNSFNSGVDFYAAQLSLFDDVTMDTPIIEYEEEEYVPTVVQPEYYYEEYEEEPLPDYEEYEYPYVEEEEVIVPVEPRYMVALTFDDGPADPTWQILDTLEYHGARATFFIIGRRLNLWNETALRIFEDGHELANHSFSHQILVYPLTEEDIVHEIQAASAAIQAITGERPARMIRPPAGQIDSRLARISAGLGYALMLWDVDPLDWLIRDAKRIYEHIMAHVEDGSIIVLHDTHVSTAEAMELVVPRLIEEGFELVTVSELFMRMRETAPSAGRVYRHAY